MFKFHKKQHNYYLIMKRSNIDIPCKTINFKRVCAYVQIEDHGHILDPIMASDGQIWFAVPTRHRRINVVANTTGTCIDSQTAVSLLFVVSDGIRERMQEVHPFSSCCISLHIDGAFGGDVGELHMSWERAPSAGWC